MGFHADNSYPCGLLTRETPYTRARKKSKVKYSIYPIGYWQLA